jgi:serine/threonine protein kinase
MTRWVVTDAKTRAGGNGLVVKVKDTTGEFPFDAAMKTLKPESFGRYERFQREVRVARGLAHENIVRVLDAYLPPEATTAEPPFLIMPWYEGGTLHERLISDAYRGNPTRSLQTLLPLLRAIAHLHERGKFHRDVKPRNILFEDKVGPILCDFGLCFDLDEAHLTLTREVVGSLRYRAPEYLSGRLESDSHGPADIFSLGKTLWAMLAAEDPPEGSIMAYPDHNLVARSGPEMQDVQHLIQGMTRQDRGQRPTIEEVLVEVESLLIPKSQPATSKRASPLPVLKKFAETDPQLAMRRQSEATETQNLVDVHNLLLEVKEAVEKDETLQGLLADYPRDPTSGPPREFTVYVQHPDDFHPGEHAELAVSLGFSLPPARAVSVVFAPSAALATRIPMVIAVWSMAREDRRVRVLSYVYTRGIPNRIRGFSPVGFDTSLDSASLRRSLLGLVPRQLPTLFQTIQDAVAEASASRTAPQ